MWFKQHPWVFPAIIGGIGLLYVFLNIMAIRASKKYNRFVSGVPILGFIHLLIAGLISPCKWLAFLCVLDFTFWEFLSVITGIPRPKDTPEDPNTAEGSEGLEGLDAPEVSEVPEDSEDHASH
jgi:hypothetical protein